MFAKASFFALIVMPSATANTSRTMSTTGGRLLARLAALDEPGVLGEAATVDEQRLAVAVCDLGHRAYVLQAHRLAAAGVVGERQHHERHAIAGASQQVFEPRHVHVALERMETRRVVRLGDHEVHGFGTRGLDVAARRVEVRVGRHDPAPRRPRSRTGSLPRPGPGASG